MEYNVNTGNNKHFIISKTSGANYEAIRILRLQFTGTAATEKFSILQEFKLIDEYREIETLREKKKVFESELKNSNRNKIKPSNKEKEVIEKISIELNLVTEELKEKEPKSIDIKEYYEKLVTILFEGSPKVEFKDIDIAVVNQAYNDFFLKLKGSLTDSIES